MTPVKPGVKLNSFCHVLHDSEQATPLSPIAAIHGDKQAIPAVARARKPCREQRDRSLATFEGPLHEVSKVNTCSFEQASHLFESRRPFCPVAAKELIRLP